MRADFRGTCSIKSRNAGVTSTTRTGELVVSDQKRETRSQGSHFFINVHTTHAKKNKRYSTTVSHKKRKWPPAGCDRDTKEINQLKSVLKSRSSSITVAYHWP